MKYLLLVVGDETPWANASEEERQKTYQEWGRFTALLDSRGANVGGEELAHSSTATTIRRDGDRVLVTDGPYAETVEQISGYMIVEAKDMDEAIELATALPSDCEIRPVMES